MAPPEPTVDAALSVGNVALRLIFAALAGGLLGLDRERHDKPAGLRTHMLVALGSATFVLLAFEVGEQLEAHSEGAFDPTRVLQGVVGGIGFLGAGSIIQGRGHVSGVTTAASVWMSGALGAAAGVGANVVLGFATLLALLTLTALNRLDRAMHKRTPSSLEAPAAHHDGQTTRPKTPPNFGG